MLSSSFAPSVQQWIGRIQIGATLAIDYLSFAAKRWVVMVNHLNKNKNKNSAKRDGWEDTRAAEGGIYGARTFFRLATEAYLRRLIVSTFDL